MDNMNNSVSKLVVMVPAYNESEKIGDTVRALKEVFPVLEDMSCAPQVYVVDDGSQDRTDMCAQDAGADRVIRHKVNRGLGAAVRSGFTAARADGADIVVKFDADLQHDPQDIVALVRPILEDEADIVYGHRFSRLQYAMPVARRVGNWVFTRLMNFLTDWPIRDSQPGIFAINRAYLDVFRIPGDYNYTQQILLDAYHKGMRFAHQDVSFRKRDTGNSFITFKYPFKVMPQIFWVIVGVKPMKIFAPLGLFFLLLAFAVGGVELIMWIMGDTPKPILHVNAVLGSMMFGLQILIFGIIAELIIQNGRGRSGE